MSVPRSYSALRSCSSRSCRRGETLIEVLAAFFILAISSSAITIYIVVSSYSSRLINDQLIAHQLAENAIESFSRLINTNQEKFKESVCWDTAQEEKSCGEEFGKKIIPGAGGPFYYTIILDPFSFYEIFQPVTTSLDLASNNQDVVNNNKKYLLYEDPAKKFFVSSGNPPPEQEPKFYRMFVLERSQNASDGIIAKSVVQWKSKDEVKTVEIKNFFIHF